MKINTVEPEIFFHFRDIDIFYSIFLDLGVKNLSFNIFKNLCEERFFQICQMHTLNDATTGKYVAYTVTGYE